MPKHDIKALRVAEVVQQREQAELVILFGSRARGDHDETRSDIDIMLVLATEPDATDKAAAAATATAAAREAYGRNLPVQLVWRTLDQFRHNRRYTNSVETHAVRDGVIMSRGAGQYGASRYEDQNTEYEYDWTAYDERLRHAEAHLISFQDAVNLDRDDLIIGQQAQNTLEHSMKALLEAHGASYERTHNIGHLLGNIRRNDEALREFRLAIPPDVYTEYEGEGEYVSRKRPRLTEYPGFLAKTIADAGRIIDRAKAVRAQS